MVLPKVSIAQFVAKLSLHKKLFLQLQAVPQAIALGQLMAQPLQFQAAPILTLTLSLAGL
jgi:hypothetical protein